MILRLVLQRSMMVPAKKSLCYLLQHRALQMLPSKVCLTGRLKDKEVMIEVEKGNRSR